VQNVSQKNKKDEKEKVEEEKPDLKF